MKKKKLSKVGKILIDVVLVICIGVAGYAGWNIYSSLHEYHSQEKKYDSLQKQVVTISTPSSDTEESTSVSIDWNTLQSMNPDVGAWIRQEGTAIDFPVVYGSDNAYYLRHTLDGEYSLFGTLFVDCTNNRNFVDKVTVIYGHHFSEYGDTMFTSLENYAKQSYYDAHTELNLYTPDGHYKLYPVAGAVKSGSDPYIRTSFLDDADFYSYCEQEFLTQSTFQSQETLSESDRTVLLSTCTDLTEDGRYALLCKLVQVE